jgi:hypothetical protein
MEGVSLEESFHADERIVHKTQDPYEHEYDTEDGRKRFSHKVVSY